MGPVASRDQVTSRFITLSASGVHAIAWSAWGVVGGTDVEKVSYSRCTMRFWRLAVRSLFEVFPRLVLCVPAITARQK